MSKKEEINSQSEKSDIKFSEKFSLKMRKTFIASKMLTILLVLVLIVAFIGLNVGINQIDLPEIDVTANKIYTLSDTSKKALENIDKDIKIYVFGIEEDSSVVSLIKQYCEANDKISYEMLSNESNLEKVQQFELQDGYSIVVIEAGDSHKIIDTSSEFTSYDYSTYAEVDTTEQTLTNSILSLGTEDKPKVYFVEGHEEFKLSSELNVLSTYLGNEAFEVASINLMTNGGVPQDCDVLAIVSPSSDFLEAEVEAVTNYINNGGNIFLTKDVVTEGAEFVNLQRILDLYGVSVDNGYILETDSNYMATNYPYIFIPQVSETNSITSDIATDSNLWLAYSEKLNIKSEEELQNLHVTAETLLETTENAMFVTDFSSNVANAAASAQSGKFIISSLMTKEVKAKKISPDGTETEISLEEAEKIEEESEEEVTTDSEEQNEEEEEKDTIEKTESKLIITANGRFFADYIVSELSSQYPISYLGSNKDFAINSIANLAEREDTITIRKDMAGTSYVFSATATQNRIVLAIIFIIPILIIIVGIIVWKYRKKRK